MRFADAHLHMTDPGFGTGYPDIGDATALLSCTASVSEWDALGRVSSGDGRVVPFYGTHPWYARMHDGTMLRLRGILENDPRACVGEIGLDATRPDMELQASVFREQLDLASEFGRPCAVHMVRTEAATLEALRETGARALLHSFAGPESYIKPFAALGCYFSVSPRIMRKAPEKARAVLESVPRDRILLETDAPACLGACPTMAEHIASVAMLLSMEPEDLASLTADNARRLLE